MDCGPSSAAQMTANDLRELSTGGTNRNSNDVMVVT